MVAQMLLLLAADKAVASDGTVHGLIERQGTTAAEFIENLFTEQVRRALMSAVQLPFAEVSRLDFFAATPRRSPPSAPLPRPGRSDESSKYFSWLSRGSLNLMQFVEVQDYISVVDSSQLWEWFQRGLGALCRPSSVMNIDLHKHLPLPQRGERPLQKGVTSRKGGN